MGNDASCRETGNQVAPGRVAGERQLGGHAARVSGPNRMGTDRLDRENPVPDCPSISSTSLRFGSSEVVVNKGRNGSLLSPACASTGPGAAPATGGRQRPFELRLPPASSRARTLQRGRSALAPRSGTGAIIPYWLNLGAIGKFVLTIRAEHQGVRFVGANESWPCMR